MTKIETENSSLATFLTFVTFPNSAFMSNFADRILLNMQNNELDFLDCFSGSAVDKPCDQPSRISCLTFLNLSFSPLISEEDDFYIIKFNWTNLQSYFKGVSRIDLDQICVKRDVLRIFNFIDSSLFGTVWILGSYLLNAILTPLIITQNALINTKVNLFENHQTHLCVYSS